MLSIYLKFIQLHLKVFKTLNVPAQLVGKANFGIIFNLIFSAKNSLKYLTKEISILHTTYILIKIEG